MKVKGTLSHNIIQGLKENHVIEEIKGTKTFGPSSEFLIYLIEVAFWGFVPSHRTHQDSFLLDEQVKEKALPSPGIYYNPVTERESLLGHSRISGFVKKTEIGQGGQYE